MKRLMYVIPLATIAVLVFAAIAAAQDVPKGSEESQEPSQNATDTNTTGVQNSTTLPPKKKPAEANTPAETTTPAEANTPNETATPDTNTTMAVDINDLAFDPGQLNIAPGTRVMFVNTGTKPHSVTADNGVFKTGRLEPGDSSWVLFEGAGTVTYHDELNPDMKGRIVVSEGVGEENAAPQGENTTPQKGTAEETPNSNESSSDADQKATEADQPLKG
jgi:plastocyanin